MTLKDDRDKLDNELKLFIIATFDQQDWVQVALETNTIKAIQKDDRLFKSLSWGDSDYALHASARADDVLKAIRRDSYMANASPVEQFALEVSRIESLFPRFYEWVHSKKPEVAKFFESGFSGDTSDLVPPLSGSKATKKGSPGTKDGSEKSTQRVSPEGQDLDRTNSVPLTSPAIVDNGGARDQPSIFLVHGHDHINRDQVAAFVKSLTGQDVVILGNQPNAGLTIIEKFEQHANTASIAIVLLTPDDFGGANGAEAHGRARQNVIFEMGYFTGRLSRKQVIPINANVEQPSDVDGLLYIPFNGDWKAGLKRELEAAMTAVRES
jgi:hypothetical protein